MGRRGGLALVRRPAVNQSFIFFVGKYYGYKMRILVSLYPCFSTERDKDFFLANFNMLKIILALILLIAFNNALCQQDESINEYSIEEINVEGLLVKTDQFFSPVKVSLIDRDKIESSNGSGLSNLLMFEPGISLRSYGGGMGLQTISANGLSSSQTLVLIDGQRMNSNQNSTVDFSLISKNNIERIEIINSGASALYGSDAVSGVLNIVTKKLKTESFSTTAELQTGSYGFGKVSFDINAGLKNVSFNAEFNREYSRNNYDYKFNNGVQYILKERLHADYRLNNFGLKVQYKNGSNSKFTFSGKYYDAFRNIPGIETGNEPSKSNQIDREFNLALDYSHTGETIFSSRIYFKRHIMNYGVSGLVDDNYINSEVSTVNTLMISSVTTGIEAGYFGFNGSNLENFNGRVKLSAFASSVFKIGEFLQLFPSLRFDSFSDVKRKSLTAKIGLNFIPIERTNLHLRLNAGNNFRVPTFNDMYWSESGNRSLHPETSFNIDAGLIYGFQLAMNHTFDINYSRIDYSDKIVWIPTNSGIWKPQNINRSVSDILCFVLESEIFNADDFGLTALNGFTINQTRRKSNDEFDGNELIYVPIHQFQSSLRLHYKNFGMNLFYSMIGKRFIDNANSSLLPAVDIVDANINYGLDISDYSSVNFRIEVNNLLNSNYQLISGYPMPLRNFRFSIKLNYK